MFWKRVRYDEWKYQTLEGENLGTVLRMNGGINARYPKSYFWYTSIGEQTFSDDCSDLKKAKSKVRDLHIKEYNKRFYSKAS